MEELPDPGETRSCTVEEAAEAHWDLEELWEAIGAIAELDVGVALTLPP